MNMNYSQPHNNTNNHSPSLYHFFLCNTRIRANYFFTINNPHPYHPRTITRSLRYYHPLPYPYTWFAYGDQAAIIDIIDLQAYFETHQQPINGDNNYNEARRRYNDDNDVSNLPYPNLIINEDAILQYQINESFQQAADFNANSGLTKEVISKNLNIKKHMSFCEEEDEEICVICQVGFEKDETIGVVECKHRYHAECIEQWLVYKNVCPLCKAQALNI